MDLQFFAEKNSGTSIWAKIKNKIFKTNDVAIGPDFVPHGSAVQMGINPNSLIPTKDLSTLDIQRMKNAIKYGGDKPIIVDANGRVLDGHHRLKYAIENNRAVDASIGY